MHSWTFLPVMINVKAGDLPSTDLTQLHISALSSYCASHDTEWDEDCDEPVEKQGLDRPSDRDTARRTSKQTAKPTGRHKDRAQGGAKWQLGREMTDFSALWHLCSLLSVKRPPGDSGDLTNDGTEEQMDWGKIHYTQLLMVMFNIILCNLNVKICFVPVQVSPPWHVKSVPSLFTHLEALTHLQGANHEIPTYWCIMRGWSYAKPPGKNGEQMWAKHDI